MEEEEYLEVVVVVAAVLAGEKGCTGEVGAECVEPVDACLEAGLSLVRASSLFLFVPRRR